MTDLVEFVVHLVDNKEMVHVVDGADGFWLEMAKLPTVVQDALRAAEKEPVQ